MDSLLGQVESARNVDTVRARVLLDMRRAYQGRADDGVLARAAAEAVAEVWTESVRVTTFIPVLAMRRAREIVESAVPAGRATAEP